MGRERGREPIIARQRHAVSTWRREPAHQRVRGSRGTVPELPRRADGRGPAIDHEPTITGHPTCPCCCVLAHSPSFGARTAPHCTAPSSRHPLPPHLATPATMHAWQLQDRAPDSLRLRGALQIRRHVRGALASAPRRRRFGDATIVPRRTTPRHATCNAALRRAIPLPPPTRHPHHPPATTPPPLRHHFVTTPPPLPHHFVTTLSPR